MDVTSSDSGIFEDTSATAAGAYGPNGRVNGEHGNGRHDHDHSAGGTGKRRKASQSHQRNQIFISYNVENDKDKLAFIYQRIKAAGMSPWCCKHDLKAGQNWEDVIAAKLRHKLSQIRCCVFLLSEHSFGSAHVKNEIRLAVDSFKDQPESLIVYRLDNVDIVGSSWELHLGGVQWLNSKVEENWDEAIPELIERLKELIASPPPPPPGFWEKCLKQLRSGCNWTARRLVKAYRKVVQVGIWVVLTLSIAIAVGGYFSRGLLADLSITPLLPQLVGADDTDLKGSAVTSVTQPSFSGTARPGVVAELLIDNVAAGQTVVKADGNYVVKATKPISTGRHDVQVRIAFLAGILSKSTPVLKLSVVNGPSPVLLEGVIEISTSSVRTYGAKLVLNRQGSYELAQHGVSLPKNAEEVKLEGAYKLTHVKGEDHFESSTVNAVISAAKQLAGLLNEHKITKNHIWFVMSSGVRTIAKDHQEECLADLQHQLRDKFATRQIEEVRPDKEAGYLLKEVLRQRVADPLHDPLKASREPGDSIVLDIGSGNLKGAYYNPGDGKVNIHDMEYAQGIIGIIPGTRTLVREAFGDPPAPADFEQRSRQREILSAKAVALLREPLQKASNEVPMFVSSENVFLAGGAAWAMCRIARPDADLSQRFVEIGPDDFRMFRARVVTEGQELFDYPPQRPEITPVEEFASLYRKLPRAVDNATAVEDLRKQMTSVKKTFTPTQLIAAAEILNEIDKTLGLHHGRRKVFFCNDATFSWLASYLVDKVNQTPRIENK